MRHHASGAAQRSSAARGPDIDSRLPPFRSRRGRFDDGPHSHIPVAAGVPEGAWHLLHARVRSSSPQTMAVARCAPTCCRSCANPLLGMVIDGLTREPVASATVTVDGADTTADARGMFRASDVGASRVRVRAYGYGRAEVAVDTLRRPRARGTLLDGGRPRKVRTDAAEGWRTQGTRMLSQESGAQKASQQSPRRCTSSSSRIAPIPTDVEMRNPCATAFWNW